MRNPGRLLFAWVFTLLLRSLRSFVVPLLCGLLLLFSAACGLSESDLRYSHPDTPIVAICDKPLDVPKDVKFWGYDFTTKRLVTAEDPAELRTFDATDVFFKYDPEAPESSVQEMPSEYGLTCPKRAKAFNDAAPLFFTPEAELWRTQAPCPAKVAEVCDVDPRLLAAPVGAGCNPPSQAKKKRTVRVFVCARPAGVPADAGQWAMLSHDKETKWTSSGQEFAEAAANAEVIFEYSQDAIPETIYYFVTDPKELRCEDKPPPRPYKDVKGSDMLPMMDLATSMMKAMGNPKKGDGQSTVTSSPDGKGKPLSFTEILTRNLSIMGALASGDSSGSLKDPNGERYGMLGGTNVGGPNMQILQAAAGVFSLLGNPVKSGKEFLGVVRRSLNEGKIVGVLDPKVLTKEMAETLAASPEKKEVEDLLKWLKDQPPDVPISQWPIESFGVAMAQSLNQAKVILPYSRASIFTRGWERFYQAHHILEVAMIRELEMGSAEHVPAVILSDVEHKVVTNKLNEVRKKVLERTGNKIPNKQQLWEIYQRAYETHPEWLEAIKGYFPNAK